MHLVRVTYMPNVDSVVCIAGRRGCLHSTPGVHSGGRLIERWGLGLLLFSTKYSLHVSALAQTAVLNLSKSSTQNTTAEPMERRAREAGLPSSLC